MLNENHYVHYIYLVINPWMKGVECKEMKYVFLHGWILCWHASTTIYKTIYWSCSLILISLMCCIKYYTVHMLMVWPAYPSAGRCHQRLFRPVYLDSQNHQFHFYTLVLDLEKHLQIINFFWKKCIQVNIFVCLSDDFFNHCHISH